MRTAAIAILAGLFTTGAPAFSQDKKERSIYRVDFIIRDGNPANAKAGRRFTMLMDAEGRNTMRVGQKVPYVVGSMPAQGAGTASRGTQYQYFDAGVNIDCRLREVNARLTMAVDFEVSTLVAPDKVVSGSVPNPTVASVHMSLNTVLDPGKSAVIATIDDPTTQRKFDIETTATRID